jgi:hypothetical protein
VLAWGQAGKLFKLMQGPFYSGGRLASVSDGIVPVDLPYPALPLLWTALASTCWFDENNARAIFPLHASRHNPISCVVDRFEEDPRLPEHIFFQDTGRNRFNEPWPPPFDQGMNVGLYSVTAVAVVGDLKVPTEFRLVEHQPQDNPKTTNDVREVAAFFAKVTNILSGVGEFFSPFASFEAITPTLDFRFGAVAVEYKVDRWLSEAEVIKTPEFRKWREQHDISYRRSEHPWRVSITLAVLLAAAILPLIIWMQWKRHAQVSKSKSETYED